MAKSQDITIGSAKPITKCRVKLQAETKMESLNLGMTYVALSRVQADTDWALVESVPYERISYINTHPRMQGRIKEEKRLLEISSRTVASHSHFVEDDSYLKLIQELDEVCDDGMLNAECYGFDDCQCLYCRKENGSGGL